MTCWNNYRCYCPDTPFSLAPPCPCVFSFAFLFQKYLLSTSFLLFLEIQRAQESADDFEIAIWFKTQCPRSYFSELLRGKARGCLGPSLHPGLCFELLIHLVWYGAEGGSHTQCRHGPLFERHCFKDYVSCLWTYLKHFVLFKQLLNAIRGHQAPRKAAHCLRKEVGKNIKDKKRDKRGRDRAPSWEGSLKKERSFQTPGNTLTAESVASLGTTEGNITGKKNK